MEVAVPSVLVCSCRDGSTHVLFGSAGGGKVRKLLIDAFTGHVVHNASLHCYETEEEALQDVALTHNTVVTEKRRVCAVLGLLVSHQSALLFVATKLRSVALPFANSARMVVQSDVIDIPLLLANDSLQSLEMQHSLLDSLRRYPLEELHYFSTLDLTRPFGSVPVGTTTSAHNEQQKPQQHRCAYVWNEALRQPFVQAGLGEFCPALLQGYCASRKTVSAADGKTALNFTTICRRSWGSVHAEFETDVLCWTNERFAAFTVRRAVTPHISARDYFSNYLEQLAEPYFASNPLTEPVVCVLTLDEEEQDSVAASLETATKSSLLCGSVVYRSFNWRRAVAAHSGKSEGAVGEVWNVIRNAVNAISVTTNADQQQHGMLIIMSNDGMRAVSECMLFLSLAVAAELVRIVEPSASTVRPWQGMEVTPSELCSSLLDEEVARSVAGLSVECSDAVTFLLAHRESLFNDQVAPFLGNTVLLSALHRKVGEYIGSLSETDRKLQEANMALLRKSCFSKRVQLTRNVQRFTCVGQVRVPLYRPGIVTHWSITFHFSNDDSRDASAMLPVLPLRVDVLIDGRCVMHDLEIPQVLFRRGGSENASQPLIFRVPARAWDMVQAEKDYVHGRKSEVVEVLFSFRSPLASSSSSAAPSSGNLSSSSSSLPPVAVRSKKSLPLVHAPPPVATIQVFGNVGLATDAHLAHEELWKLRVMNKLSKGSAGSWVSFVLGPATTNASGVRSRSNTASADGPSNHGSEGTIPFNLEALPDVRKFAEMVRLTNVGSLTELLRLETKRVSLGLSEAVRDQILYDGQFDMIMYDPRRLMGYRDSFVEEGLRTSVPASFTSCSSGAKCRGKDAFTLSITRNRSCYACRQRFCSKCIEEAVLLEGRVASPSPVCFACRRDIDEQRAMWVQLQKSSDLDKEDPEAIAFYHVLRLCAVQGEFAHKYAYFPFVHSGGFDVWQNVLFLDKELVPPALFWKSYAHDAKDRITVALPHDALVSSVVLIPPPNEKGWNVDWFTVSVEGSKESVRVERGTAAATVVTLNVASDLTEPCREVIVQLQASTPGLCIARIEVQFEMVRRHNVSADDLAKASPLKQPQVPEIFGKKKAGRAVSRFEQGTLRLLPASVVEETVRFQFGKLQRLLELPKTELRGNILDLWLVKVRNSVAFPGGGLVVRVRPCDELKVIRVTCVVCDRQGEITQASTSRRPIVVPRISTATGGDDMGVLLWYALPPCEVSFFSLEFFGSARIEAFITTQ